MRCITAMQTKTPLNGWSYVSPLVTLYFLPSLPHLHPCISTSASSTSAPFLPSEPLSISLSFLSSYNLHLLGPKDQKGSCALWTGCSFEKNARMEKISSDLGHIRCLTYRARMLDLNGTAFFTHKQSGAAAEMNATNYLLCAPHKPTVPSQAPPSAAIKLNEFGGGVRFTRSWPL